MNLRSQDVCNLPTFTDHGDWDQVQQTMDDPGGVTNGNRVSWVQLVGYDAANGQGIYPVLAPRRDELEVDGTR